jgi:hypothetical protein
VTLRRAALAFVLALAVQACGETPPARIVDVEPPPRERGVSCAAGLGDLERELCLNRSRWNDRVGASSYEFRFSQSCECPTDMLSVFQVRVVDGRVESIPRLEEPRQSLFILSVPGVFDKIEDAIRKGAHSIRVRYDSSLGYPAEVDIDYDRIMADEELSLRLSGLVVLR